VGVAELTRERVEEFLAVQRAVGRHRSQWSRPGLLCLMEVLAGVGVIGAEPPPRTASPTDELLESFAHYLRTERALAAGTVGLYVDHARRFLAGRDAEGWAGVTSGEVTRAVLERSCAVSVSTAQNFVAALRALLRFGFVHGHMAADLSPTALAVTGRRRSTLPLGITHAQARAILAGCDRRRAIGRRDYAIIVLLLRLGLRRSEVAGLTLDDIDWRAGELVVRGKGSRSDRLPCRPTWGRRSLPTCAVGGRSAIGGRCFWPTERRCGRSRPGRSPQRCGERVAGPGCPRWDRIGCGTPQPAR
jgi:hypothetical protein